MYQSMKAIQCVAERGGSMVVPGNAFAAIHQHSKRNSSCRQFRNSSCLTLLLANETTLAWSLYSACPYIESTVIEVSRTGRHGGLKSLFPLIHFWSYE